MNENAIVNSPKRPWYERYQPVSYNVLTTRSGTEQEFAEMVRRCNAVNVRIYVDVVINHMTGSGRTGKGTGGSSFNAPNLQFPEYSSADFNSNGAGGNCPSRSGDIEDYSNPEQARNCRLSGLVDLDQGKTYVRNHIAGFLNKLIGYGVAGFRVDASKHMWPADLKVIYGKLNTLPTDHGFPAGSKPFIFQEVIDFGGEPIKGRDYFELGRVTEFKYGKELGGAFRGRNDLKWLSNWGVGWGLFPSENAVAFIDNHDNQRGHGAGGDSILTFRQSKRYKMATAFMLAHPYGVTRIMSSYNWEERCEGGVDQNNWVGPPSDANGNTLPVVIKPDYMCDNGWVCEVSSGLFPHIQNIAVGKNVT